MAKKPQQPKGTNTTVTTETNGGKQSLETRLANARALVAKYEAMLNSQAQINNVQVGDEVTYKFGRSDKSRTESGTVTAVGDTPQGRVVAIQTGEGLDIVLRKVRAADILSNPSADARNAEPANDAADADPLAAE